MQQTLQATSSDCRATPWQAFPQVLLLLWIDRGAREVHDLRRRCVEIAHDLLYPFARERRDVDAQLVRIGEELRVFHRGVERPAQDCKLRRRSVRRRDEGAVEHLLAED